MTAYLSHKNNLPCVQSSEALPSRPTLWLYELPREYWQQLVFRAPLAIGFLGAHRQTLRTMRPGDSLLCLCSDPVQLVAWFHVMWDPYLNHANTADLLYEYRVPVQTKYLLPLLPTLPAALEQAHQAISETVHRNGRPVLGHRLRPATWPQDLAWLEGIFQRTAREPFPAFAPFEHTQDPLKPDDLVSSTGLSAPLVAPSKEDQPIPHRILTQAGMSRAFQQGLTTGGRLFGYQSVPVYATTKGRTGPIRQNPIGYRWIIHPEEAAVVRYLFEQYRDGMSIRQLCKELTQLVPTRRWTPMTLYAMFHNTTYIGQRHFVYDRQSLSSTAEATLTDETLRIIDQETWNAVVARRARTGRPTDR